MTEPQMLAVRILADPAIRPPDLSAEDRAAIRAMIDERDAYVAWAEAWLARYYEAGYSQTQILEAMAELRAIHARATGGAP